MTEPYHMSEKDDWGTPQSLFDALDREFHFNIDVCATPSNTKCSLFYSPQEDGLQQPWHTGLDGVPKVCWCNPPYSHWEQWVGKACEEVREGATVVILLAARTDTRAFHRYLWDGTNHRPQPGVELRFLKGRLTFEGAPSTAPFPSMLAILRPV